MQTVLRFLSLVLVSTVLITGGFNCNLLTGPHRSSSTDTTSSNFTWTVDTIGASGSYLYDCCIVNDTLAYAVGEMFPRDSAGGSNQSDLYNAAVWNGTTWRMIKVPYNYQGQPIYNPIHAVFALGPNDIWFGGNGLEHWDGHQYSNVDEVNPFWSGHLMQKIWASSDNNIYIVGDGGIAVHYDGTWHGIQTGTTLPFQDIWGDGGQVLAVASNKFGSGGQYIVQLNGNVSTHIEDTVHASVGLSGIWLLSNQKYFIVGNGIYEADSLHNGGSWDGPFVPLNWFSFAVRGQAANDVIVAGESASISHFNGARWTGFNNLVDPSVRLQSVAIKGNLVIAAGFIHDDAQRLYYGVAYVGRRADGIPNIGP